MNALQVKLEMERLVPAKMTWEVEEIEFFCSRQSFPRRAKCHE
jgi:hypothetical protein